MGGGIDMENPTFGLQMVLLICAYVMTVVPLVGWFSTRHIQQELRYHEYIEAGFITHVAFGLGVGVGSLLVWAFKGVTGTLFGWWN